MKKVLKASFVENENQEKFFYVDFVSPFDHRPCRIWLSASLIDGEGNITFPAPAVLTITAKGSLVLRKDNEHITHYLYVKCGYRGTSFLEILHPPEFEMQRFRVYHSPRGSLGVSEELSSQ